MLGFLYLVLSFSFGYFLVKKLLPSIQISISMPSLLDTRTALPGFMLILPASFYVGTLITTWFTYLLTWVIHYFFPLALKPLFYGNLLTFIILFTILSVDFYFRRDKKTFSLSKLTDKVYATLVAAPLESGFCFFSAIFWTFYMVRSFKIIDGRLIMGISAFSDFGATIPLVRSFSVGSNFPTEYPHFAGAYSAVNDINYHFMFHFLSGNLEYLGLRLDYAFNLPSILSITALMMLIYALAVIISGEKTVGLLASFLFLFRSSFAAFTFLSDRVAQEGYSFYNALILMLSKYDSNIGNTLHENWGFWTQKVYINKRHLSFSMGIAILAIILFLPLFKQLIDALKSHTTTALKNKSLLNWKQKIKAIVFDRSTWLPEKILEPILIGIVLGLATYWNGAMVICALLVLAGLAFFTSRRLELLVFAMTTVALILFQSLFFMQSKAVGSMSFYTNFLMHDQPFTEVLNYYFELFGILPFFLLAGLLAMPKPIKWLTLIFFSPLVIANVLKFSPDVGANHVIILFSILLLNIIVAMVLVDIIKANSKTLHIVLPLILFNLIYFASLLFNFNAIIMNLLSFVLILYLVSYVSIKFFSKHHGSKASCIATVIVLIFFLSVSGIIDAVTLYNMDNHAGRSYALDDPVIQWAISETDTESVFLTHPQFNHLLLMAGRKVFVGWGYFTSTAGYDGFGREALVKEIYSAQTQDSLKEIVKSNHIDYIVVEDANRNTTDYVVNESLISNTYPLVYEFEYEHMKIYQVH